VCKRAEIHHDALRHKFSRFIEALAARLEQLIAEHGERLGVEKAARLMHVSRRTLARRLRQAGASYRAVMDARRKRRAEWLLHDRQLNVAEVAYELGYEDTANFGRACRRWFGMSPAQYRDKIVAAH